MFGGLTKTDTFGYIFAVKVLPTIIFFSSLMSILYHLGIMQRVVSGMAKVMRRTMGLSGAESLSAAANVFVGMTEAPLVIRPYVAGMTQSELMAVMTGGFATVAGGVLVAYVSFGIDAGHLLAASVMSAPAAMVLAFVALVAMVNSGLKLCGTSLEHLFGLLFRPVAFCMGVEWQDTLAFGNLIGQKIVLNEFIAYSSLKTVIAAKGMSPRSITIATYALCGFANFGSVAIQIGGIGALAENRRQDLARLGLRALAAGAMASFMTASVAGILI